MKKNWIWFFIALMLLTAGIYLTKSKKSNNDDVIRVGAILPLSGNSSADAGEQIKNALELYKKEFNDDSNNVKLEIIYGDSKNSAREGIAEYKRLKEFEKINLFLASNSGVVVPLLPEASKDDIILMTTVNSAAGVPESGDNIFRIFVSIQNEASTMSNFINKDSTINNIAVLYINDEFGISGSNSFKEKSTKNITQTNSFEKTSNDFRSIVSKISDDTDAVYVIGYDNALGVIIKQLRESGFKGQIYSTIGMSIPPWRANAGKAADKVIYTGTNFNSSSNKPEVINFVKKFSEQYPGKEVTSINVFAYYSIKALVESVKECKKDKELVKCCSNNLKNSEINSIMGDIRLDEKGEADLPLSIYIFEDGKDKIIE